MRTFSHSCLRVLVLMLQGTELAKDDKLRLGTRQG